VPSQHFREADLFAGFVCLVQNGPIDLCSHHFQQHKPAITAAGYHVVKAVEAA